MRFSTVFSSLFCLSSVLGASLHQHLVKRSSTDVCVSLDLKFEVNRHFFGHLDACVCLSTLDLFIEENALVREAARIHGVRAVKEYLKAEIYAHSHKKKCHYPPHAFPAPAPKCHRGSDPCDFKCDDGFTANHKKRTCECEHPNIIYNGKCIPKPGKPGHHHPHPSGKPYHEHHDHHDRPHRY